MKIFQRNNSDTQKGKKVLILDIGSSSIGIAIAKNFKGRGKAPLILKSQRTLIKFPEDIDYKTFVTKSQIAIKSILDEFINLGSNVGKIDQVRIFYAPPWYKIRMYRISKHEKHPKLFTARYLGRLLKEYAEPPEKDIVKIENEIITTKLNGYETNKPYGKKMKNVVISKYSSMISEKTHKSILEIINKFVNCEDVKFATHPFSAYKVLMEKFGYKKTYTIIDVGGEVTEITVVRDNDFEEIISLPVGTQFIVRELSKKLKTDYETAFSKLQNMLDAETSAVDSFLEKILVEIKLQWLEHIGPSLNQNKIKSLPLDIFLIVNDGYEKIMSNILNDVDAYYNTFRFGRRPNISVINSGSVTDLANYQFDTKKDAFISMEAGFLEIVE